MGQKICKCAKKNDKMEDQQIIGMLQEQMAKLEEERGLMEQMVAKKEEENRELKEQMAKLKEEKRELEEHIEKVEWANYNSIKIYFELKKFGTFRLRMIKVKGSPLLIRC